MTNKTEIDNSFPLELELAQSKSPSLKQKLGITSAALLLFLGIHHKDVKDTFNTFNSKTYTTQSFNASSDIIDHYKFKIDENKETLTMPLEFRHREGDLVINNYEISLKRISDGFEIILDYGDFTTPNKRYENASLDVVINEAKEIILEENGHLDDRTLEKLDQKFTAAKTIVQGFGGNNTVVYKAK